MGSLYIAHKDKRCHF